VWTFPPQSNRKIIGLWWKCSDGWDLFFKVSILTFYTIFLLDCGGNVQTGWYLFVKYPPVWKFPPQSIWKIVERVKIDTLTNKYDPVWTIPQQSNRKIAEMVKIDSLANKYHPVWTFPLQSYRKTVEKVKKNTITNKYHPVINFDLCTIFVLDCGGNVQTGGICLLRYQCWPFLRFFYWIVVEMFRRSGICLLGYRFWHFLRFFHWTFPPQSNRKIVEKVKINTITNKYHPVWTFTQQSNGKILEKVKIDTLTNKGWYLFVKVSILTLSTIFLMDCGGNVQTGGICLLGYQFCPFVNIDSLTNKYHPVWTFPPQSIKKS
jgi:hypothetical protein